MNTIFTRLLSISLFYNIDLDSLQQNLELDSMSISQYKKGATVVNTGDSCSNIGIVLEGMLSLNQYTKAGHSFTITMYQANDMFGLPMFSMERPVYPYSLVSKMKSTVLFIPFSKVEVLIQNIPQFSRNFIKELSRVAMNMNYALQILHHKDVRSRLIGYMALEYERAGKDTFYLPLRNIDIADLIGVAVPSVSRELHRMIEDGLIYKSRKKVTLLKPELFHL